ncbi:MAG: hypothetical protein UT34_C0001G0114 [candidate division WS6 bacterium GW2011_GWF2_39_15]|uniref:Transglutaminase-like domain-containing protein n=1 Tax=candidate division WS6 bacterium GW2011_GWF2_39_15 TaxID=1619100 RepID=A0A0G0MPT6_9BACT|nr:MAG: hypothetical protein UT34_C0001G0114 [candidate division WS6 bacterium GW2011_GWF2_39_15]
MTSLIGYLKRTLLVFSGFLILLSTSTPLIAAELTRTNSSIYHVNKDGDLSINYAFTLAQSSNIPSVITNFTFTIPFSSYDSLKVNIEGKDYKYSSTKQSSGSKVYLSLPNLIAQKGSPLVINVTIVLDDYVKVDGENYVLLIPPILSFDQGVNKVEYPSDWGNIVWSSVEFEPSTTAKGFKVVQVKEKSLLSNPALSLVIGKDFGYNLSISKELSNSGEQTSVYRITLPREGNGQHVLYSEVTPSPFDIELDSNDNLNISYLLKQGESITIKVRGYIYFDEASHRSPKDFSKLLQIDNYWSFGTDTELKRVKLYLREKGLPESFEGESNVRSLFISSIYDYVLERLTPSSGSSQDVKVDIRHGVSNIERTISEGASPDDYTDLLIALLRYMGVPTRMILGYISPLNSYQEKGFFHSWGEYWDVDSGKWIILDPALQDYFPKRYISTSLDHIALVSRNESSIKPQMSVFSPDEFNIEIADAMIAPFEEITSEFKVKGQDGNRVKGDLIVKNRSNKIYQIMKANIIVDKAGISPLNLWSAHTVLPNQETIIPLVFSATSLTKADKMVVTIADLEGTVFKKAANLKSTASNPTGNTFINLLISLLLFTIIYMIFKYLFRKRK